MALIWSSDAKAAQMNAVYLMMVGGKLELGTDQMKTLLASIDLPAGDCACVGNTILCTPQAGTYAVANGRAAAARVRGASGNLLITGLTVGTKNTDAILDYVDIKKGQIITVAEMQFSYE